MAALKPITSALICIIIFLSFFVTSFASDKSKTDTLADTYRDSTGEFMIASDSGDTSKYPENSLPAITSAAESGADIVKINIRKTADSVYILMTDETLERTCFGATNENIVSEMNYSDILKFNLLSSKGGFGSEKTDETVPTLEDVLKLSPDCLLMLDFDWSEKDEITNLVSKSDMLGSVIFYIDDAKPSEITSWKESLGSDIMTMAYFKGNVIFSSNSNVKKAAESSEAIHLASKVPYTVNFGETVQTTAYNSGIRTMASVCIPELCGTIMTDTEQWWDYLFSSGISIILTDRVSALSSYLENAQNKYDSLKTLYSDLSQNWTLPDFNSDNYHDYKLAYTNACSTAEKILKRKSCSRSLADQTAYELKKAYDDINANYELFEQGIAGLSVKPVQILLAVVAVAAAVTAQLYILRKKEKK